MGYDVGELAWVYEDHELAGRLDGSWPSWHAPDGLLAMLDQSADWNGWRGWDDDQKRAALRSLLDAWYPASDDETVDEDAFDEDVDEESFDEDALDGAVGTPGDRVAFARRDPRIVERLTGNWPNWTSELAGTLDAAQGWDGWDGWPDETKLGYLSQLLDHWFPPQQSATAEHAAPDRPVDQQLAAIFAEAKASIPDAAELSEEQLAEILTELLNEEIAKAAQ